MHGHHRIKFRGMELVFPLFPFAQGGNVHIHTNRLKVESLPADT